jgi:hypothetical protein
MRKFVLIILTVACLGLTASAQKDQEANKPHVDQTQPEWNERVADVKRRTGKTVRLGRSVADPKRRGKIRCYTLDAWGWELAFGTKTEYGGVVCVRSR